MIIEQVGVRLCAIELTRSIKTRRCVLRKAALQAYVEHTYASAAGSVVGECWTGGCIIFSDGGDLAGDAGRESVDAAHGTQRGEGRLEIRSAH